MHRLTDEREQHPKEAETAVPRPPGLYLDTARAGDRVGAAVPAPGAEANADAAHRPE